MCKPPIHDAICTSKCGPPAHLPTKVPLPAGLPLPQDWSPHACTDCHSSFDGSSLCPQTPGCCHPQRYKVCKLRMGAPAAAVQAQAPRCAPGLAPAAAQAPPATAAALCNAAGCPGRAGTPLQTRTSVLRAASRTRAGPGAAPDTDATGPSQRTFSNFKDTRTISLSTLSMRHCGGQPLWDHARSWRL